MKKRKGIILAGGHGSRLMPMTGALSKQVLPVYDKPMVYYPLSVLMLAGISDILIISSPNHMPLLKKILEDLGDIGVNFEFRIQIEPRGIAEALIIADSYLDGHPSALILGDNIFFGHGFRGMLKQAISRAVGATVFAYPVHDPSRYGVLELDDKNQITNIAEKPVEFISNLAVTGLYFYDEHAPAMAKKLTPSKRGELEITDLNKAYLKTGTLNYVNFGRGFAWLDAGTPDSLLDAANFVSTVERRQGIKIAAPEEISFENGWISQSLFLTLPNIQMDNDYASYLKNLIR